MKLRRRLLNSLSRFTTAALAILALAAVPAGPASAQPFPSKPIRILVGFAPGGAPDFLARVLAQKMADPLGQPVIVENRPGATGNIAAEAVAKGEPDGHMLLMATVSVAISASFLENLRFSPEKDFEPVGMVASVPLILVAHPSVQAKNIRELLGLAKQQPGKLNYASVGSGSPQHLSGELFNLLGSVNIVHIPYKGGGPATQAVLAGETHMFFAGMPPAMPHLRAGRLKALAVTSAKRSPAAPDVPTMAEAGLTGFEADNWHALYAPKGTPSALVAKLNAELNRALALPGVKEQMLKQGAEPWISTPQEAGEILRKDIAKWAKVVKASGAKPQ